MPKHKKKSEAKPEVTQAKQSKKSAEVLKKELSERAKNPAAPQGSLPKTSPAYTVPAEVSELVHEADKEKEKREKRVEAERKEAERVAVDILNQKAKESEEKAEEPSASQDDQDSKALIVEAKRIVSENLLNERRKAVKDMQKKVKDTGNDIGYAKRDLNEAEAQVASNKDKARNVTVWVD